jgi:hypothetical protein
MKVASSGLNFTSTRLLKRAQRRTGMKDLEARRAMLLVASLWEAMAMTAKGERPG